MSPLALGPVVAPWKRQPVVTQDPGRAGVRWLHVDVPTAPRRPPSVHSGASASVMT